MQAIMKYWPMWLSDKPGSGDFLKVFSFHRIPDGLQKARNIKKIGENFDQQKTWKTHTSKF